MGQAKKIRMLVLGIVAQTLGNGRALCLLSGQTAAVIIDKWGEMRVKE